MYWRRRRWFDTQPAGGGASAQSFAPDGWATHADHAAFSGGTGRSMLVGAWVQITSRAASQTFVSIYDTGAGPGEEALWLYYNSGLDRYALQASDDTGSNWIVSWNAQPPLNTWQFLLGEINLAAAEADVMNIRVNNGTPVAIAFNSPTANTIDSANPLRLGRTTDGAAQLTGAMDNPFLYVGTTIPFGTIEAAVYNSGSGVQYAALTAGQKASLAGWWSLDETSGDFIDSHTNGLDLTRNGTFTPFAAKVL